jgi:hypothetical protein
MEETAVDKESGVVPHFARKGISTALDSTVGRV